MSAVGDGYVALLRLRGVAVLLLCASAARLVYGVLPLGLLLFLSGRRASYAEAGAVVGVYGVAAGVLGPARARLVDRVGAAWGLAGLAAVFALCLGALVAAVRSPLAVVLVLGLLAGCCPPPVGPMMRTAWRSMVGDEPAAVRRAYSLDAVTEEAAYVLGPVLATTLLAWVGSPVVVLACAGVLVVVVSAMGWQIAALTHAAVALSAPPRPGGALRRDPRFLLGLVPVGALGLLLGAVEIAAVAAALTSVGQRFAGVPATVSAVGSLTGGLLYGRKQWPGNAHAHTVVLTLGTAALVAVAGLAAHNFVLLVALLGVAGLTIAPAIVASYLVADLAAPVGSSEATAWVNSAFNTSLAVGTAFAGAVVDATSPGTALAAAGMVTALLVATVGIRPTRHGRARLAP